MNFNEGLQEYMPDTVSGEHACEKLNAEKNI